MLQPPRIWRINNQMVRNELGSRVNSFRVTTRSWQRLVSWFLGSRQTTQEIQCPSAHKMEGLGFSFFKLCLNAQYCHEKVLVGTWASLLLMSSCGWQKRETQKFLSLGPFSPFWLKMITQLFYITRARRRRETNGCIAQTSFIKDYSEHGLIRLCRLLLSL